MESGVQDINTSLAMASDLTSDTSDMNHTYGLSISERQWVEVGIPVVFGTMTATGVIGNGLVIAVLLKYNNMKTIPNIYILNLAIMDFTFLLTLPFQAVQIATFAWPFGRLLCKLITGCDTVNQFASIYLLTFMSADRYIAVVYPLSSIRYRTKNKTRILCSLVWILSILLAMPTWIFVNVESDPDGSKYCGTVNITDEQAYFFAYFNFLTGFLLPLIVIIMAYTTLLYKMLHSNLPLRSDGASSAAQRASKRVSILTISVIIVFFVCWMPYHILQILHTTNINITTAFPRCVFHSAHAGVIVNSCFNPLLYTFIGENFKKNLADMCPWCFPKASKFDQSRGRDSSTYTRGGPLRLHNVHNEYTTSPTMAQTTTLASDGYSENSPKIQTYTFND